MKYLMVYTTIRSVYLNCVLYMHGIEYIEQTVQQYALRAVDDLGVSGPCMLLLLYDYGCPKSTEIMSFHTQEQTKPHTNCP